MSNDDEIRNTLTQLMDDAHDLGYSKQGTRADDELALITDSVRIRLEPRFIHGEGRLVLLCHAQGEPNRWREIRITGSDDYNVALADLQRITRTWTAVPA